MPCCLACCYAIVEGAIQTYPLNCYQRIYNSYFFMCHLLHNNSEETFTLNDTSHEGLQRNNFQHSRNCLKQRSHYPCSPSNENQIVTGIVTPRVTHPASADHFLSVSV